MIVIDFITELSQKSVAVAIEVLTRDWQPADYGLTAKAIEHLPDGEMSSVESASVLDLLSGDTSNRGPFFQLGWIAKARNWIKESVTDQPIPFNESIHQLNASGDAALVRFGVSGNKAIWLKAAGALSHHEYRITQLLVRYLPQFLPPLIAHREDWAAWAMEDAGVPLKITFPVEVLERTVMDLADLQIQSSEHTNALLLAGCRGHSLSQLESDLPSMFCYLQEAMENQTLSDPPRLSRSRVHEIGERLQAASSKMQRLAIPDTLLHNDANLGNVLWDGTRSAFIDWAEGAVGNPFFTFEQLRVQIAATKNQPGVAALTHRVKMAYRQRWLGILSSDTIEQAFLLVPPLAVASYLYGRSFWLPSSVGGGSGFHSYARSLIRHMDRAFEAPELKGMV